MGDDLSVHSHNRVNWLYFSTTSKDSATNKPALRCSEQREARLSQARVWGRFATLNWTRCGPTSDPMVEVDLFERIDDRGGLFKLRS